MNKIIKRLLMLSMVLSIAVFTRVHAQQNHFIYIQADDKQLFTAALNGKVFNASSIGYVILPKLADGKYQLTISFPNKKYPDQQFECVINKTDAGYALKNFGQKGWGLFNLQTLDVTMAGAPVPELKQETVKANGFGDMLSDVVNDSTIKAIAPVKPVVVERKEELPVTKTDAAIAIIPESKLPVTTEAVITKPEPKAEVSANKAVTKVLEQQTDLGIDMLFFVNGNGAKDTVRILLPPVMGIKKEIVSTDSVKLVHDTAAKFPAHIDVVTTSEIKKNAVDTIVSEASGNPMNPFFNEKKQTDILPQKDAVSVNKATENLQPSTEILKPGCKNMISDEELNKLRKKMFSTTGDQKMIDIARKSLQDKCLTTLQVKTLSGLFLSDGGRYIFFEAAYVFVSDSPNFALLENQLIDTAYKKRFAALIK